MKELFVQNIKKHQKFLIFHMKVLKGHILLRLTVESINLIQILLEQFVEWMFCFRCLWIMECPKID